MEKALETFDLLKQIHKDKVREENSIRSTFDNHIRQEFELFRIWCRAFKNSEITEDNFKEYQKKEHKKFSFWEKKKIAELFFGYVFEFNYDTKKWSSKKIS